MTKVCVNCGYDNRSGIIFCENCGEPIEVNMKASTRVIDNAALADDLAEQLRENPLDTVRVESNEAESREGTSIFDSRMMLRLEVDGMKEAIMFRPYEGREMVLGRRDPQAGYTPEIDLMPYGGYSMGISRRHAILKLAGKRISIRDLGSSNGTFINNTRLDAEDPHQLRDGDRLRLGSMIFSVHFDDTQY